MPKSHHPRLLAVSSAAIAVFAGLPVASSYAQLQTAGNLLLSIDSSTLPAGTLGTWTNSGTLGGTFTATGAPTVQNIDGIKAVYFDGKGEWMTGPNTGTTGITGVDPTRTIEAWVYTGNIQGEESVVAWGHRGGNPDGSNVGFGYGTASGWGAVGEWGAPDIGWDPAHDDGGTLNAAAPAAGKWHQLVYTYDGHVTAGVTTPTYTTRLYVDGALVNSEVLAPGTINTFQNQPFVLGNQNNGGGNGVDGGDGIGLSAAIGKVRVSDGVLSAAQVQQNFNLEKTSFGYNASNAYSHVAPQQLTAGPTHRYNFNNAVGAAADGAVILDSVGTANAVVRGAGAAFTGTGLDLPGGSSATQAYVDMANGLISGNNGTSITLETWVTVSTQQSWSRVLDFGSGTSGEVTGPGGGATGTNYVMIAPGEGTSLNGHVEHAGGTSPNAGGNLVRTSSNSEVLGIELQEVLIYDSTLQEWRWYENGVLQQAFGDTSLLTSIPDVNDWLGRSNFAGDANLDGTFDEFRIYNYALSEGQVVGDFAAGPNVVNVIPEPGSALLAALSGVALTAMRRRRSMLS